MLDPRSATGRQMRSAANPPPDDAAVPERVLERLRGVATNLPLAATGVKAIRSAQLVRVLTDAIEPERARFAEQQARLEDELDAVRSELAAIREEKRQVEVVRDQTRRIELPRLAALVDQEKTRTEQLEVERKGLAERVAALELDLGARQAEAERLAKERVEAEARERAQAEARERAQAEVRTALGALAPDAQGEAASTIDGLLAAIRARLAAAAPVAAASAGVPGVAVSPAASTAATDAAATPSSEGASATASEVASAAAAAERATRPTNRVSAPAPLAEPPVPGSERLDGVGLPAGDDAAYDAVLEAERRASRIAALERAVLDLSRPDRAEGVLRSAGAGDPGGELAGDSGGALVLLLREERERRARLEQRVDALLDAQTLMSTALTEEARRRTTQDGALRALQARLSVLEARDARPSLGALIERGQQGDVGALLEAVRDEGEARATEVAGQVQRLSVATRAALERMAEILDQALVTGLVGLDGPRSVEAVLGEMSVFLAPGEDEPDDAPDWREDDLDLEAAISARRKLDAELRAMEAELRPDPQEAPRVHDGPSPGSGALRRPGALDAVYAPVPPAAQDDAPLVDELADEPEPTVAPDELEGWFRAPRPGQTPEEQEAEALREFGFSVDLPGATPIVGSWSLDEGAVAPDAPEDPQAGEAPAELDSPPDAEMLAALAAVAAETPPPPLVSRPREPAPGSGATPSRSVARPVADAGHSTASRTVRRPTITEARADAPVDSRSASGAAARPVVRLLPDPATQAAPLPGSRRFAADAARAAASDDGPAAVGAAAPAPAGAAPVLGAEPAAHEGGDDVPVFEELVADPDPRLDVAPAIISTGFAGPLGGSAAATTSAGAPTLAAFVGSPGPKPSTAVYDLEGLEGLSQDLEDALRSQAELRAERERLEGKVHTAERALESEVWRGLATHRELVSERMKVKDLESRLASQLESVTSIEGVMPGAPAESQAERVAVLSFEIDDRDSALHWLVLEGDPRFRTARASAVKTVTEAVKRSQVIDAARRDELLHWLKAEG